MDWFGCRIIRVFCPTCGPVAARPWIRAGRWRVIRCQHCGLGITWPRPSASELASFYGEGYYDDGGMGDQAAEAWLQRAAGLLALLPIRPRRVLDIGAGQGHFVVSLRRLGIEAEGVEPFSLGRDAARRTHEIALHSALPESGVFDLVTFIHSLEHVVDPLATLQASAERLTENGHLLIELPHIGSAEMHRPARRRQILSLPGHLHHFTPASLKMLLKKASIEPVRVELRNPDALEWVLARRAEFKTFARPGTHCDDVINAGFTTSASGSVYARRLWRERLLPYLRSHFPGWSFAIVAERRRLTAGSNDGRE